MIAQAKISVVKEYLQREFPDSAVDDEDDFERVSWKFRVANGSAIYIVKFERPFWDDATDVKEVLEVFKLSRFMKDNQGKQVFVTKHGLTVF
jgi:hypothetical protein